MKIPNFILPSKPWKGHVRFPTNAHLSGQYNGVEAQSIVIGFLFEAPLVGVAVAFEGDAASLSERLAGIFFLALGSTEFFFGSPCLAM